MAENTPTSHDSIPNGSEAFGRVPHDSERFRSVPNGSESFRSLPKGSERKENHTLTVREVARMFEAASVARTERSITNWCQENKLGIARLDAYFDPNERRYFITAQSAELAIQEEKAKVAKVAKGGDASEPGGSVPHDSETPQKAAEPVSEVDGGRVKALELEVMDLKITNRGKDYFIEQLQKEREGFALERQGYVEQLVGSNRKIGELETKLLQLGAPLQNGADPLKGDAAK